MAARLSRKKVPRYSLDFKVKAVRLTRIAKMEVQTVAKALDIHPVMLSRWRQEMREGRLRGAKEEPRIKQSVVREIQQLQRVEKAYALLQEEHELLKKAIRFCSETRPAYLRSSKVIDRPSR